MASKSLLTSPCSCFLLRRRWLFLWDSLKAVANRGEADFLFCFFSSGSSTRGSGFVGEGIRRETPLSLTVRALGFLGTRLGVGTGAFSTWGLVGGSKFSFRGDLLRCLLAGSSSLCPNFSWVADEPDGFRVSGLFLLVPFGLSTIISLLTVRSYLGCD